MGGKKLLAAALALVGSTMAHTLSARSQKQPGEASRERSRSRGRSRRVASPQAAGGLLAAVPAPQDAAPSAPKQSLEECIRTKMMCTSGNQCMFGEKMLDEFRCPIRLEIMEHPYTAADGSTYERDAIEDWLRVSQQSPVTNKPLESLTLYPNHSVQKVINMFRVQCGEPEIPLSPAPLAPARSWCKDFLRAGARTVRNFIECVANADPIEMEIYSTHH